MLPSQPQAVSPAGAASVRSPVSVIIPALNEAESIEGVVRAIPAQLVDEVIVVDNGSTDSTAALAWQAGAKVVAEPRRGYGRACRAGVLAATESGVLVFVDGDGSDCPELMGRLLGPILAGTHDFVIGSRLRGQREPGSMNTTQVWAGRIAGILLKLVYGVGYSDMCPFRAIRSDALQKLGMKEETYGWNLEMQMRAARAGLRILEVPVDHRRRAGGKSKVSGNVLGTIRAAVRILLTFVRVLLAPGHA
jgi:glycosyltransferase involved in cell wall biosynthesis